MAGEQPDVGGCTQAVQLPFSSTPGPGGVAHRHVPQGGELGVLPGQGAADGPEGAWQVCAEGPEDDGERPPLPVQGVQEAEEGGQDQVVALARFPREREDVVWPARPLQQPQVAGVEAAEAPARARLGEGGVPAVAAVVAEGAGAGGAQGGAIARPLPLACKRGGRSAAAAAAAPARPPQAPALTGGAGAAPGDGAEEGVERCPRALPRHRVRRHHRVVQVHVQHEPPPPPGPAAHRPGTGPATGTGPRPRRRYLETAPLPPAGAPCRPGAAPRGTARHRLPDRRCHGHRERGRVGGVA